MGLGPVSGGLTNKTGNIDVAQPRNHTGYPSSMFCRSHVRFGSLADICTAIGHVRFIPESDRESGFPQKSMSALPRKRTCAVQLGMSAMGQNPRARATALAFLPCLRPACGLDGDVLTSVVDDHPNLIDLRYSTISRICSADRLALAVSWDTVMRFAYSAFHERSWISSNPEMSALSH